MQTFAATVTYDGGWFLIDVSGVGITQAATRDEVWQMATGLIVASTELNRDDFDVDYRWMVP